MNFEKHALSLDFLGKDNRTILFWTFLVLFCCFYEFETHYFLEVLKISKYMMLLARFIVAPACCNQRPKEPALLHHSEKLHFVLHYFASLNMLTFDLSAGNAWQPLKTL